jgi:predicted transglutaminase-like cysteine proteinase
MKKTALILVSIILISILTSFIVIETNNLLNFDNTKKIDTDGDGVYDNMDDFPNDPAASMDTDNDGYPDSWNIGKNQEYSNTNLTIDAFPDDPAASIDSDGDGYPDSWNPGKDQSDSTSIPPLEIDEFPDDPNDYKDTDKDGVGDYYDINDFVNLFINIKLERFKVTGRVDLLRWAQVYFVININGEMVKKFDNNGRYWNVLLNQETVINVDTISYDIPDDTQSQFTEIEIIMYDYDFFGEDDVIDISDKSGENTLILNFDNVANTISDNSITRGSKGILWYDITYAESSIPEIDTYNRTYRWMFNDKQFKLSMEIPVDLYDQYLNSNVKRNPYAEKDMIKFVTSSDLIINDLSDKLLSLAENENYDSVNTINFILRFVQENIEYVLDNSSKGVVEYWRYPVETLVEKKGDCEDSSVLFASIMDSLNYDVALIFYTWTEANQNIGHLAVGIHLDGDCGSYVEDNTGKKYFYCETTTSSYVIGKLPPELKDKSYKIIQI